VRYLDTVLLPPAFYTAFPAGGGGRTRGALLKAAGLKAGLPDLLVTRPTRNICFEQYPTVILGIELKAKAGLLSAAQHACHKLLIECGWVVCVCRSIEEVHNALEQVGFDLRPHKL